VVLLIEVEKLLREQFAMGTHAHEPQRLPVRQLVDQQQVGLEMTFPMTLPVSAEAMIAMPFLKRLIVRKQSSDYPKEGLNVLVPGSSEGALIVPLECRSPFNRSH